MKIFSNKGFTIIEVVIAGVIIAMASMALVQFVSSGQRMSVDGTSRIAMMGLAQQKIEDLRPYVRIDWWGLNDRPMSLNTSLGAAEDVKTFYQAPVARRSYTVSQVNLDDGGGQPYRKVVVKVVEL